MKRVSSFEQSTRLRKRAHALIPGGAHTYAKGDDQYPKLSPSHIVRGKGCRVWDADGNEYIEYGMGNRAVTLGHAYEPVLEAVRRELENGSNFSRPAAIEVEAAATFLDLIDNAEMVKFCKDGSDAVTGAVKLARCHTGRDLIAICADHPFFSVDDWFIGSTAIYGGVPESVRALTVKFNYNDIDSVKSLLAAHPGQIAGFVLEPARIEPPERDFLAALQRLVHADGGLLIFDEMITGFRMDLRGGQRLYGVDPDLSAWGKALANGFSVSALAGKREFMRLGDLEQTDFPRVFLLSTTHGGETHALAAAKATIAIYRNEPVIDRLYAAGAKLRAGMDAASRRHGLQDYVAPFGFDCSLLYQTLGPDLRPSQEFRTLFLQETIKRGVIMPSLVVSYSHTDADLEETIEAIDGALEVYAAALSEGVEKFLEGPPSATVYRTWNPRA